MSISKKQSLLFVSLSKVCVIKSYQNTESEIKMRYFKLLFIGLHSNLMQMKVDKICKTFYNSVKGKLAFTNQKLRCAFSTKDSYPSEHHSKVFVNLFALAVMLVMLVRLADIWQTE